MTNCRFVSDGTIEYSGFKAVYQFIPNPLETLPFIPKCEFEVGGSTGFIGKTQGEMSLTPNSYTYDYVFKWRLT